MDELARPPAPLPSPATAGGLRYVLTRADALAYERHRPIGRAGSILFVAWMLAAGVELGIVAGDWNGDWRFWLVAAALAGAHFLVGYGLLALGARLRARRRIPVPVATELDDCGDRIVVSSAGEAVELSFAEVAAHAVTATHLIVSAPPRLVIVPRAAFATHAALADLVGRIEAAGRDEPC